MATPTDGPTMETSGVVSSDPTMETSDIVISDVPMVPRCFPGGGVVSDNFKVTGFVGLVENAKVSVSKLYLCQVLEGWNANQSDVIQRQGQGKKTVVNNWGIYDGAGPKAKLVAKGQGMHTLAGNWNYWFTLVFEVQRCGTGEFAMARGIIERRGCGYDEKTNTSTQELTMEFFCRMKKEVVPAPPAVVPAPQVVPAPTKRGTVGGNTGSPWNMDGKSKRLESVTISHHGAVEGFQFSYVDENGQRRTVGPWGLRSPVPQNNTEITFEPSEFVKEIKGAQMGGVGWLSKFEIVTTHKTYGPFGFNAGAPYSSYTVPEGETVVGFFAKTNYSPDYVTTIGVYTI